MKKNYESPMTEMVELNAQNVILSSYYTESQSSGAQQQQGSTTTPVDKEWD